MTEITLLFPHQLFQDNPAVAADREIWLIEEPLYFQQFKFHKQKIRHHRATMQFYKDYLEKHKYRVTYIEAHDPHADVRKLVPHLKTKDVAHIHYVDLTDDWLSRRLTRTAQQAGLELSEYPTPMFINSREDLEMYFMNKKRYFQADFYTYQRQKQKILVDENGEPEGGRWSFDTENRLKYPRKKSPPDIHFPAETVFIKEAEEYVEKHFSDHYGNLSAEVRFPISFSQSKKWLSNFLESRLSEFGAYEDAMVTSQHFLHHSVLTPMLNTGLITPRLVVSEILEFSRKHNIPLNSTEGFIRQIIGWREFMHGVYEFKGRRERTTNYWKFTRKLPESFWTGETGIEPVDVVIKKVLETGYCHHIERLMVMGNFMLLCEIDPDDVYRWFMELFIDAYDWVMVPNVYGMSQFADGGLMATKPYISSSNYLLKMGDFSRGEWTHVWDGLFWRFMDKHRKFFMKNPRLGMLIGTFDNMPDEKQQEHLARAEDFLKQLDQAAK
ncbi:cryptochrome/photolyase family protein [Dyadobacter sandarakinus]|uniref:Cryptochrome/photolyase family protein n=1 Tax=Dyadobacter sandarakinus TaxID=2747268 RepID=A0ABX7IB08_9BACT|nr:cryptochrome/photolyase family protein [Dyadobacter sandarakinus]QRR03304.1 cryptochrome/photolyase family protein [Dyadobacter sandarakinus]